MRVRRARGRAALIAAAALALVATATPAGAGTGHPDGRGHDHAGEWTDGGGDHGTDGDDGGGGGEPGPGNGAVEVLGRQAEVPGPNGSYVGPDGLIYQASVVGDQIVVVDPADGQVVDRIGPERCVRGPDDVFVTDDGTVYWTEILGGYVGRLLPDGTCKTQFVAKGVNPIAMRDDGRLFTALDFLGNGLYELDPELEAEPQLLIPDIDTLNGFTFGPDGRLYGPLFFNHQVVAIDVDVTPPTVEVVAEGFTIPSGVEFDSQGRMIVTDFAEGQVLRIDLDTGERETLLDIEGIIDNSSIGSDDTVYAAAFGDGQIWAVSAEGEVRAVTGDGFIAPGGIAVGDDGSVYVGDWFSLRRFQDGENTDSWYDRFTKPFEGLASANTVSADGANIIVTGWFSNALQVIDPATGEVLEDVRDLATVGNAIRHGDDIVATETGAGDVVRIGDRAVLIDRLEVPTGLASDGETLYVADWGTGQVRSVAADGTTGLVASGLDHPEGLALDGAGHLLVAEEGADRVTSIDLATGDRTVVAHVALGDRFAPGVLPYGVLTGVAVDEASGSFWVTSDIDDVAYRFELPSA